MSERDKEKKPRSGLLSIKNWLSSEKDKDKEKKGAQSPIIITTAPEDDPTINKKDPKKRHKRGNSTGSMPTWQEIPESPVPSMPPVSVLKLAANTRPSAAPINNVVNEDNLQRALVGLRERLEATKKVCSDRLIAIKAKLSEISKKSASQKDLGASVSKLEKLIDEWLSLSDEEFKSDIIKRIAIDIQQLQQNWQSDWPVKTDIQQVIIYLAQLTPILEHLELDPEEFRLALEVEADDAEERGAGSIDRDMYNVYWAAPFKYLESANEAEQKWSEEESDKADELVLCRICEELLPSQILEPHSELCVKLSKCEMELVGCDQELEKFQTRLEQEHSKRMMLTDPQSRKERKLLEETFDVIATAMAYVNSQSIYEARAMITFANASSSLGDIDPTLLQLCNSVGATINQKLDVIRRGMQASREQAELRKIRALSSLEEIVSENPKPGKPLKRSTSIAKAFHRKAHISDNLNNLLAHRPNQQALVDRKILKTEPKEPPPPPPRTIAPIQRAQSSTSLGVANGKQASSIHRGLSSEDSSSIRQLPSWTNRTKAPSIQDFSIVKVISRGAFGRVFLAKKRSTGDYYAIKVLRKKEMMLRRQVDHVKTEKNILTMVNNPFVVKLYYSFESENNLYLVMEYLNGGDLYSLLKNVGNVDETWARFYAAELVHALDYLHSQGIVHRDLKPDNLLINRDGHLKLTDFGLSKSGLLNRTSHWSKVSSMLITGKARGSMMPDSDNTLEKISRALAGSAKPISGTPDYLAPETIMGGVHGPSVDWWAVGVILYEMIVGIPPFNDDEPHKIFENILLRRIEWPEDMASDARDLIDRLLNSNPNERLGSRGSAEVKNHPYFSFVTDWNGLLSSTAPFVPNVVDPEDTDYFANDRLVRTASIANMEQELTDGNHDSSGQFGNFAYKSIDFLERANHDVIQKARTSPRVVKKSRPSIEYLRSKRSPLSSSDTLAEEPSRRVVRCLIASGNPVIRRAMQAAFRRHGILTALVEDGRDAVRMCTSNIKSKPYDVIYLDLALPVIAGVEAAKLIRAELKGEQQTMILLFTAIQEDKEAFEHDGGSDYIQGDLTKMTLDDILLFAPQSSFEGHDSSKNSSRSSTPDLSRRRT